MATQMTHNIGVSQDQSSILIRLFGWSVLSIMLAFLINNFLTHGAEWPGSYLVSDAQFGVASAFQVLLYPALLLSAFAYVLFKSPNATLRSDSALVSSFNTFFIRAAFWAVLLIGIVDVTISFLRVEGFLELLLSEDLNKELRRPQFRGVYVHMPLLFAGIIAAIFTRTLGFQWLALMIVAAELLIVISRFIFSYEQAFMGDLVRFWYGALFLFASAYTLLEEGHVRVDVFYAGFENKTKGYVNAIGSVVMGLTLCWVILIVGMGQKTSIINSPVFTFETSQSGFGMYIKYLMAAFLGVFAVSMMIQFVSYLFGAVANIRQEPGEYKPEMPGSH